MPDLPLLKPDQYQAVNRAYNEAWEALVDDGDPSEALAWFELDAPGILRDVGMMLQYGNLSRDEITRRLDAQR